MGPKESHGNRKHKLNSWELEREWEWWKGNEMEMGIVVWKIFPLVALIIFLALYFSTGYRRRRRVYVVCKITAYCLWLARWTICDFFIAVLRDLTVLWLTRELACLYFVADILSLDVHFALHVTILLIWYWTVFDAYVVFREWFGREWDEVAEFKWDWE